LLVLYVTNQNATDTDPVSQGPTVILQLQSQKQQQILRNKHLFSVVSIDLTLKYLNIWIHSVFKKLGCENFIFIRQ